MDGAGIVEEIGAEVRDFVPGDEVWYYDGGYADKHGSYAEYKIVNGLYLAPKPTSIGFAMAAATPVVALTAWEAVVERADVQEGDFVLVHGGAGGVGHICVQLAASRGAHVATTVSGSTKAALARSLGAELAIDYKRESIGEAIKTWSGKGGADVVLDFVGRETFASSFDLVAPYGTLVNAVVADWPQGNNLLAEYRNLSIKFVNIGWPQVNADHEGRARQTRILRAVSALVDQGKLRVHLDRTYALADVSEAHRALEAGEVLGRVVVEI
jgi:NADPH2:quinone reductase